jgi:predicted 3-demethylubiquinone-9 3-methyltransferase (glyoxalase superfamily)
MTTTALPFLMFQDGAASAALDLYVSLLPEARIDQIERYGPGQPGPEGQIRRARFTIGGQSVLCMDSPIRHAFAFTPSFSFWLECPNEDEVRRLDALLKAGGSELMPVGRYGFSKLFSWITDRFGVSWQINCA